MSDTFDFQLSYTEPATATADHWELLQAPGDWAFAWVKYRDMRTGVIVYLYRHDILNIEDGDCDIDAGFIDRLQSLKALARQHFGDDWGKE